MLRTGQTSALVGLDIEAGSVAAAEVSGNGSPRISRWGLAPLAPGVTREGEVTDPKALGGVLKELFSRQKLAKNVRVGIANQRVVVRTMQMPRLENPDEIEAAVRFQAAESIAMPLDQAVIDWQVVSGGADTPAGRMDVVVVAARRESIAGVLEAVSEAGLKAAGIDVSAFGMVRALPEGPAPASVPSYEERESGASVAPQQARLLCNLGDLTNLAVSRGNTCVFTRVSPFGIEGIAQRLAERKGLTLEHSRQWLGHVGLEGDVDGDPELVAATREALAEGADRLAGEIRLSLEYYGNQDNAVGISEIIVSGAGAVIPGLPDALQRELGYQLRFGCPEALSGLPVEQAARLTLPFGLGIGS